MNGRKTAGAAVLALRGFAGGGLGLIACGALGFIARGALGFIACGALGLTAGDALAAAGVEPPSLAEQVADGRLPPVRERLPDNPRTLPLDRPGQRPGRHGGTLRMLMARGKDARMMVVYGYARLLNYTPEFEIVPDVLERLEVQQERVFTLHLRKGHKWSDGYPLTSEDFRYYWEDVANEPELSPAGPPGVLRVAGELARFEVLDEHTVRYAWDRPNPYFRPALAGARPPFIYRPAHYLRQFHRRYADPELLPGLIKRHRQRNWAALHNFRDDPYKNDNPDRPALQPWINTTVGPSDRYVFERNPYFHRVDPRGLQLPYVDRVTMAVAGSSVIPAKTGSGESDLQARYLQFSDYTFLKESERRAGQRVVLWRTTKGAHLAIFPNLTARDPVWRALIRDVRFRRALSLAIDRHEINQVLYYGLAVEGNNSIQDGSALFRPEYRDAWARFDLAAANALLDQVGLTRRAGDGTRLLPDGRRLDVIVETAGEGSEQADALELIRDSWRRAGIKLFTKPSRREVFRNRIFTGTTAFSIWSGLENGLPTPDASPAELAPTAQTQLQWPRWGQHFETRGRSGEAPDLAPAQELLALYRRWNDAVTRAERVAVWRRMLDVYSEQVFTIGVVASVPQPVVFDARLRNVPRKGIYNWDPGAHFGMYHPDLFWLDETAPDGD